jgi:hypothetical protein
MNNLYILTVANKSKYYYPYLVKSVKKYNNKLITLGFNKEWIGYNTKYKLMFDKLNDFKDDDIICFVDGFDVICVRDLNELTKTFINIKNREKCNIIVGYDNNKKHYLLKLMSSLYFTEKINSIVINSGTYIGYVKDIRKFLLFVLSQDDSDLADDQILMNSYNKLFPNEFYIDINTEIFFTIIKPLHSIKEYINIKNNIVYSNKNNNKPFFIHAAACGFLNDILEELNYNIDTNIEINLKKDYFMRFFIMFKNIFIFNKYKILFSFIIFFIILYIFIEMYF